MISRSLSSPAIGIMERGFPAKNRSPKSDVLAKVLIWVATAVAMTLFGVGFGIIKAAASGEVSHGVAAPSGKILVWVDREGKEDPISAPANEYRHPRISPDGTRVAMTHNSNNSREIWIWDLARKTMAYFVTDGWSPLWTPDGKQIVFASSRNGKFVVLRKAVDGSGEAELLFSVADRLVTPWCWSKDGRSLILYEAPLNIEAPTNIGIVSFEGNHSHRLLISDKHFNSQPRISPDGGWIAYTSDESGQNEVYVSPYPQVPKSKRQVSTNGGDAPIWSPNGRELFFRSGGAVVAVHVTTGPTFGFEKQRVLFRGNYLAIEGHNYQTLEISPDGKRFLMLKIVR